MPKTIEALQSVLEKGDVKACLAFFADASPAERAALAKTAEARLKAVARDDFIETAPGRFKPNELMPAAQVAVLATCSQSTLQALGWRVHPGDELFVRVMQDRRPPWLDEYAESLLEGNPWWRIVRGLVRAGLCPPPKHDNYVLGMTHLHAGVGQSTDGDVLKELLKEPDLLEQVWRLFELEGGGEHSLAAHDKFAGGTRRWDTALVELSRRDKLPRSRLLDASLDALDRGFAQFRAGWFSAFHELLEPTVEERTARLDRYLRLLASPIPPTVTFAFAAIEIVDRHQPLPAAQLVEGLRPMLLARAKGTVKAALKLLSSLAKREPAASSRIARLAADALNHEASDVQTEAFKLIEKHGDRTDAELRDAVRGASDRAAASLRGRISEWLGSAAEKQVTAQSKAPVPAGREQIADFQARAARLPAALRTAAGVDRAIAALERGELDLTGCEFDGTEMPRLGSRPAIQPVTTLDELIDASLAAIEDPDQYDVIERVFDGVSRLCDQRPDDFDRRTGSLLKRARQLMTRHHIVPFSGMHPMANLLGVLLSWLSGQVVTLRATRLHNYPAVEYSLAGLTETWYVRPAQPLDASLAALAQSLAERAVQRRAGPLLSAPTHAGGWIHPVALATRALADTDDFDQALALLRLAPDERHEALPLLKGRKGEFVAALRYALGGDFNSQISASNSWLWAAAARARSPWIDDSGLAKRHEGLGPDAFQAASASYKIGDLKTTEVLRITTSPAAPAKVDARLLSVLLWKPDKRLDLEFASVSAIRARQSIWPLAMEAVCAEGAAAVAANLDWWEARWMNRAYLEPLLDPDLPLRPMALLLLLLGLAAKDPSESGLAADAAIAAVADGRLDPEKAGAVMAGLLPTGLIKAARWAKTLGVVAQASPLHAIAVCRAISFGLRGKPAAYPGDLHALVELLKELVIDTNSSIDADTQQFLSRITGSSKLAKAAKTILASQRGDAPQFARVQSDLLAHRLARVERWTQSTPGTVNRPGASP